MPLPIRDGNQSLTTLSTILVSNSHIPAHTVVSLGTQAITDIATAVSGVELGPNTLNALENITVTLGQVTITGGLTDAQLRASSVTIGGVVTATISGTSSVTFGTAVVTGSASILNFPSTQTVTFTQAPVTFGMAVITGSTSILNFPATQSVTFGTAVITGSTSIIGTPSVTFAQVSVTFGVSTITGSVSVLNIPATQTVTFGTSVVTGSISVLNIPATQTVTFTQASVTFSQPTITGSVSVLNFPASQSVTFTTASVTFGTAVITGSTSILGTATITGSTSILNFPATQAVSIASVTIGNSITISSLPALVAGTAQIGSVTVGNTVTISGTVTANPTGTQTIAGTVTANSNVVSISLSAFPLEMISGGDLFKVDLSTINDTSPPTWLGAGGGNVPISGTVTAMAGTNFSDEISEGILNFQDNEGGFDIGSLPSLAAGTAQIGSVTASISNSVTIASLPAISGTVTANTFALQGTAVTTSNFTSTTASTVLANYNATREVLSIFNEGAGNLHICAGATCTTIAYQVRLSAGDYYEVPNHQTTITHSAVFATAGTARVTEVS